VITSATQSPSGRLAYPIKAEEKVAATPATSGAEGGAAHDATPDATEIRIRNAQLEEQIKGQPGASNTGIHIHSPISRYGVTVAVTLGAILYQDRG
jgi:hypothetical protein